MANRRFRRETPTAKAHSGRAGLGSCLHGKLPVRNEGSTSGVGERCVKNSNPSRLRERYYPSFSQGGGKSPCLRFPKEPYPNPLEGRRAKLLARHRHDQRLL